MYSPPKIAVLYIATGRYIVFWPKFYESAQRHFLPQYEKHYFIFTDDTTIDFPDNVTRVERAWHPWPHDTLDRFEMFLSIQDQLKKYDYIWFLNANAEFVADVGEDVLPSWFQGMTVVWHPYYYKQPHNPNIFPYERNPLSTAYVPFGEGKMYAQDGFNGGRTRDMLKMYQTLYNNIKTDVQNGVMAQWHDESHMNRYIADKNPLVVAPNYVWPYHWKLLSQFKNNIKIVMRDKDSKEYGGRAWLRKETDRKIGDKPTEEELKTGFYLKHKIWKDYLIKEKDSYCRFTGKDCATVEKKGKRLIVKWHNWPAEEFILNPTNGMYEVKENKPHAK